KRPREEALAEMAESPDAAIPEVQEVMAFFRESERGVVR
ncbi:MAG: hypothetical protein ABEK42_03535, partial [Thiohalorhabdaceae bacterium]